MNKSIGFVPAVKVATFLTMPIDMESEAVHQQVGTFAFYDCHRLSMVKPDITVSLKSIPKQLSDPDLHMPCRSKACNKSRRRS